MDLNMPVTGKKVLIVYAHHEPKSMNGSLKDTAVEEFSKQGCTVTVSDLYAMQFNATATKSDITGELSNLHHFKYGTETMEAFKKGSLCEEIIKEQKKVQDADLVIFQFPLYWFSFPAILKGWIDRIFVQGFAFDFPGCYKAALLKDKKALLSITTGGTEEMYTDKGMNGDIRYILWPIQHGILHFCGFKVMVPQIFYAPEYLTEGQRKAMIAGWAQRLQNIWDEKSIDCSTSEYLK